MILLVDDNVRIACLLAAALHEAGQEVRVAHSADQALTWLASLESIQLLVCYLLLAGRSGLSVAAAARRVHPRIGILLMSGTPVSQPGAEFILKPFDAKLFLGKVGPLLAQESWRAYGMGC